MKRTKNSYRGGQIYDTDAHVGKECVPHLLGRYPPEFTDSLVVKGPVSSTQELSKIERADLLGVIAIREQASKILPFAVSWRHAPEKAPECLTASRRQYPCRKKDTGRPAPRLETHVHVRSSRLTYVATDAERQERTCRAFLTNESGAMDGDVSGCRTRPQREVRLIRFRLGRRLEADPDVSGYGAEVEPSGQVVGYADCQGA